MKSHSPPSGFQIAFLVLAVLLLAAPLDKYVVNECAWIREAGVPVTRMALFMFAGIVMFAITPIRAACARLLRRPIPPGRRLEPFIALAMNVLVSMGAFGAFALWNWSVGGEPQLARRMGEVSSQAEQWSAATSGPGIVLLVLGALAAPLVEELIFRGFIYNAWQRQWGWVKASLATSIAFGVAHGAFLPQLLASLVFIAAYRRSSSLWAPVLAHAAFNTLAWYPLLGQFAFPAERSTGELHAWWFQLACLALTLVALPVYLWLSRNEKVIRPA
jgi:membrane protease YdiL (CAAX protease family)